MILRPNLLTPQEAATRLGVSPSTVYRWFWEGLLSGTKLIGGKGGRGTLQIEEDSVEKMLNSAYYFFRKEIAK